MLNALLFFKPSPRPMQGRLKRQAQRLDYTNRRNTFLVIVLMDSNATELREEGCYVALTNDHLSVQVTMDSVRSPQAGAIVIFAG